MEKKSNKKAFIIVVCILVIVITIIIGTIILKKDNNIIINNTENTEPKEETNKNDYSAFKEDIKKVINEKNVIKAVGYYNVLKFSIENDKNANTDEYDKIANNLQILKEERKVELLNNVDSSYDDMKQQTIHVECVAVLQLKQDM